MRWIRGAPCIGTLFKIQRLIAFFTGVRMIKLIGKYFYFCSTMATFTDERFQVFKRFKSGTVTTWGIHSVHLQCLNNYLKNHPQRALKNPGFHLFAGLRKNIGKCRVSVHASLSFLRIEESKVK